MRTVVMVDGSPIDPQDEIGESAPEEVVCGLGSGLGQGDASENQKSRCTMLCRMEVWELVIDMASEL